jgi:uncharacterized protein YabE (DUF348 family)
LPVLEEIVDPRRLKAPRTIPADGNVRPAPSRPHVRPSPARARPHDPAAWLPLPDVDTLPELEELLTPDQLVTSGQTRAVDLTQPVPVVEPDVRARRGRRARTKPKARIATAHWLRRVVLLVLTAATATALALALPPLLLNRQPHVTLAVDGKTIGVSTGAQTVAELLRDRHVRLHQDDRVVPGASVHIKSGMTVRVHRAFPVTVDFDGSQSEIRTTRTDPAALMRDLKLDPKNVVAIAPQQRLGRAATVVFRTLHTGVTIAVDGTTQPEKTAALTVGDFVAENQVVLNPFDQITPPMDTRITDGLVVTVSRITGDTVTTQEPIDPPAQIQEDPNAPEGQRRVAQPGVAGIKNVTFQRTLKDGAETDRHPISQVPIKQPVPQIVVVGTMKPNGRVGSATWYDTPFGPDTCATKSYVPMGTSLRVTNLDTGASTTCRVADRVEADRVVDLSKQVFAQLAPNTQGTFRARIDW